jgi:15-cis-phytoene synthase
MEHDPVEILPPELTLAMAWTPQKVREPLRIAFELDQRLARIVARTTEPMLGQMRLAWWREALGKPVGDRPRGDAVLDAIGQHWVEREVALMAMVDGWEVLITAEHLTASKAAAFAEGRGAFFAALAPLETGAVQQRIKSAAARWALADAVTGISEPDERTVLLAAAPPKETSGAKMPPPLRGLAVLDALAQRAIFRGGRPLMDGRGAAVSALKAAIFLR